MPTLRCEEDHLALADKHIAEGNERIAKLMLLLEREKEAGLDTTQSEILIYLMQSVLKTFSEHRQRIIEEIDRLRRTDRIL